MKYDEPAAGEWVRPVRKGYRLMCCSCGRVHAVDFRTVPRGKGRFIQFRVYDDKRATAAARKAKRYRRVAKAIR